MQEATKKRKHKREEERTGKRVVVRLTQEEYQTLTAFAERATLSLAGYVRERSLEQPTTRARRRPSVEVSALVRFSADLNRVGNNLNQLARRRNSGEAVASAEIEAALAEHRQILANIISILGKQSK